MPISQKVDCPTISIEEAIERTRMIYDLVQDHLAEKLVLADAMNYRSLHGSYYAAMNALAQYELMETIGNQHKLSAYALEILQTPKGDTERSEIIKKVAFAPQLFDELHNQYGDALVDDDKLKAFFRKRLSPSKVDDTIRAYRGTIEFIKKETEGSNIESLEEMNSEVTMQSQTFKHNSDASRNGLPLSSSDEKKETELKFMDSGGYEVLVRFNGIVTSERLQDLIEFAQFQKKMYLKMEAGESRSTQKEEEN